MRIEIWAELGVMCLLSVYVQGCWGRLRHLFSLHLRKTVYKFQAMFPAASDFYTR